MLRQLVIVALLIACTVTIVQAQSADSLHLPSLQPPNLSALSSKTDSLKPDTHSYQKQIDSLEHRLTGKIDSLKKLNLPTDRYNKLVDSLRAVDPSTKLKAAQQKLNQSISDINRSAQKTAAQINNGLGQLGKETGDLGKGLSLPNVKVPQLNNPVSNLNLFSGKEPSLNVPGNVQLPNGKLPDAGLPALDKGTLPSGKVPGIETPKELNEIKTLSKDLNGYSSDAKAIAHGNLDSTSHLSAEAEKKATELVDVKDLKAGDQSFEQYKSMAQKPATREGTVELAKQQLMPAMDHFAGKEKQLMAAMDQMTKFKNKYSSVASIKDLPKRMPNEMHGKPLRERLVPAFNWQFQSKDHFLTDFNPAIGYRLTGHITTGLGWNERMRFDYHRRRGFRAGLGKVYGPRAYGEYRIARGISSRVEIETMNMFVPRLSVTGLSDPGNRQWVWGVMVGMKKEYQVKGNIRGNIQTLYNLASINYNESPYLDKLQVRMGIELNLTKKPHFKIPRPDRMYSLDLANRTAGATQLLKSKKDLLRYRFGRDSLFMTKKVTSRWKSMREVRIGADVYRLRYDRKKKINEILDSKGNVIGETKNFHDVTLPDGSKYLFYKMSDTECRYMLDGKEVVRARLSDDKKTQEMTWADKKIPALELTSKLFLIRGR